MVECLNYQLPITIYHGTGKGKWEKKKDREGERPIAKIRLHQVHVQCMLRSESDVTKLKSHDTRELRQCD